MQEARQESARHWLSRTEVTMHRALQFLVGGGQPYHCTAGDSLITVQPNGDVYPCRRLPIRVGNLLETPMAELYYSSDLLCALRDRNCVSHGCEACYFARLCRGGLKCLSYATANDAFVADPGCWLADRTSHSTPVERKDGVGEVNFQVRFGPCDVRPQVGVRLALHAVTSEVR